MRSAYEQLKIISNTKINIKYNWYLQVRQFFITHDMESEFKLLSPSYIKDNSFKLIGKLKSFIINTDVKNMCIKDSLTQFKLIKTHIGKSDFFNLNLPWNILSLIQQIRLNQPRVRCNNITTNLNSLKLKWNNLNIKNEYCDSCKNKIENIYHILFECKSYAKPRKDFLWYPSTCYITTDNFLINLFNADNTNVNNFKNIYYFWNHAMTIRTKNYENKL